MERIFDLPLLECGLQPFHPLIASFDRDREWGVPVVQLADFPGPAGRITVQIAGEEACVRILARQLRIPR